MSTNIEVNIEDIETWISIVEGIKSDLEEGLTAINTRTSLLEEENDSYFINDIREDIVGFYNKHGDQEEALDKLIITMRSLLEFAEEDICIEKKIMNTEI